MPKTRDPLLCALPWFYDQKKLVSRRGTLLWFIVVSAGDVSNMAGWSRNEVAEALMRLGKAVALTLPLAIARAAFVILGFGAVNLAFAVSVWLCVFPGIGGHAGAGVVTLTLAAIPFVPFFVVAAVMAHKQAVSRVLASIVESQSPLLALVGEQALSSFLESGENSLNEKSNRAFGSAWQRYLRTRSTLPWAVRFLLSRLCAQVTVLEILDELSTKGVSREDFPREFMSEVIRRATSALMRPRFRPVFVLLLVNVLWFGIVYAYVKIHHS